MAKQTKHPVRNVKKENTMMRKAKQIVRTVMQENTATTTVKHPVRIVMKENSANKVKMNVKVVLKANIQMKQ